jgi:hypothetical protein
MKTDRSVHLPAPLLFNLVRRNGWSLTEGELDAYMEEHPQPVHNETPLAEVFFFPGNGARKTY